MTGSKKDRNAAPPERPSRMDRDSFVAKFGGVFEHSPWIAEQVWDDGAGDETDCAAGLHVRMCAVFRAAPRERRLAVLLAHPDLAGRLAVAGALTAESTAEQSSAGLDRCTAAEFARFQELNAAYVARFSFPFIMAVKGRTRTEILDAFERRVLNTPGAEFTAATDQVERIARLRLDAMFD